MKPNSNESAKAVIKGFVDKYTALSDSRSVMELDTRCGSEYSWSMNGATVLLKSVQSVRVLTSGKAIAAIAATGMLRGFVVTLPLPGHRSKMNYGDIYSIRTGRTSETCAVILEVYPFWIGDIITDFGVV